MMYFIKIKFIFLSIEFKFKTIIYIIHYTLYNSIILENINHINHYCIIYIIVKLDCKIFLIGGWWEWRTKGVRFWGFKLP